MWADTLLHAEQQHLLRLLIWAALSIVSGTAVGTMITVRRVYSPMLTQFAVQMVAWGLVIAVIAGVDRSRIKLRDLSAATRLERLVWVNIGLDAGYVAVGVALALSAWFLAKRMSVVGAGVGVIIQGLALLIIEMQFAAVISR